jgi:hypothetical protein
MNKKFVSDVDIDFGDRANILNIIKHTAASISTATGIRKHNSGIYVTDIPYNSEYNMASINYEVAENRGYVKIDALNVWLYKLVRDETHLVDLMRDPDWSKLKDREYVQKLIQIGGHYETISKLNEPIDSIPRLAMFISAIRPGKYHLIGKSWKEMSQTIWNHDDSGYSFKKSHAIAYAHLVAIHMNLLVENPSAFQN